MRFLLLLLAAVFSLPGMANAQGGGFRLRVEVETIYLRAAPSRDAQAVTSAVEDQIFEAVGRNLDGSWFQVRYPNHDSVVGWIFAEMTDWDFAPEYLPLADFATGVEGPQPLAADPGYAVFVIEPVTLRQQPDVEAARLTAIPHSSTVPLLGRNFDGSWLFVNYRGYEGWIAAFTTRVPANLAAVLELSDGLPPASAEGRVIIPPEVQLAQLNRLRDFVNANLVTANSIAYLWQMVFEGHTMPCQAPLSAAEYTYTSADVRELPELQRHVPRINEAIGYLNDSMEPLYTCGAFDDEIIGEARANAINARVIFEAALETLAEVEEDILH